MKTVKQIKIYMDEKKITQTWLADKMGLSTAAPCYWFKGKRSPNIRDVEKACEVLGLEILVREKTDE